MPRLNQIQQWAQSAAVVGVILCFVMAIWVGVEQFFQSYLMAYIFWFGLTLGSLALLMIHHLAGFRWSFVIRRPLEAGAMLIPLVVVLFIPIVIGMGDIYYRWLDPEYFAGDALILGKQGYLNVGAFLLRTIIYFGIWFALAWLFYQWSGQQDKAPDGNFSDAKRMRLLAAGGMVLYVVTMTMASVDWAMSIEPHFYSAIYGVIYMVGQGLSTLAFMLLLVYFLSQKKPMSDAVGTLEIHSLSKMMLAFVVLWTYVSYGQYIIIWSGNIPEFTPWYIHRTEEGWSLLALALILFYFAVPFFLLLSRRLKQNLSLVWGVAVLILVMRMVEIFWLIAPDFYTSGLTFDPMYIGAHLLLGGIWLTSFVWMLKRRPLLPTNELRKDPRVQEGHAHA
jgi:hypothetical protein